MRCIFLFTFVVCNFVFHTYVYVYGPFTAVTAKSYFFGNHSTSHKEFLFAFTGTHERIMKYFVAVFGPNVFSAYGACADMKGRRGRPHDA